MGLTQHPFSNNFLNPQSPLQIELLRFNLILYKIKKNQAHKVCG